MRDDAGFADYARPFGQFRTDKFAVFVCGVGNDIRADCGKPLARLAALSRLAQSPRLIRAITGPRCPGRRAYA